MADNNNQRRVQEVLAEIDNIMEQLRGLKARAGAVQTVNEHLRRRLSILDEDVGLELKYQVRVRQEILEEGIKRHQCGMRIWRARTREVIREFVIEIEEIEEEVQELSSQNQAFDLIPAVITQQQIDDKSKNSCSVCIDDFKLEETVKKCSGCQNYFHNMCMTTWLADKQNCPLCRRVLRT